ncbi:MAG: ATP-binding protein [Planctomycetaceae bacterium]|nr:ATP-binding protein [Planctomycetaceae bacterium]
MNELLENRFRTPGNAERQSRLETRARRFLEAQNQQLYRRTDRALVGLMILQWLFAIGLAWVLTPTTWDGDRAAWSPHWVSAVGLGAWLVALPLYLGWKHAGEPLTRHSLAIAQMLWASLLIHITGGRIETHFHVFGSLAFLSVYRDWRVLLTASAVVIADHGMRSVMNPESVYGESAFAFWRTLEHAGWIVFEDVFLMWSCVSKTAQVRMCARQHAELEESHAIILEEVRSQTEQLRYSESEARRFALAADAATKAKTAFLANMSHEIRTPMTAIVGFAELLVEDGDITRAPQTRIEAISTIRRNGEHLLNVINDILDVSKIEADQLSVESLPCDLYRLLADVQSTLQSRTAEKGLELRLDFAGLLPRQIQTDPTRLRQILLNVIGNAIKFTSQGGVRVLVHLNPTPRGELVFDVIDSGIGMTREQQERIFQPFGQADDSMSRRFGGTGLGLVISRRLAQLLGGDLLLVSSIPEVGTTMRIVVATGDLSGTELIVMSSLELGYVGSSLDLPAEIRADRLAGCRVLLAEDHAENQRLIEYVARKAGAEVTTVSNGRLAVEAALAQGVAGAPYDVILMDMQMPVMDGYDATATLRAEGYSGSILALTASAMSGDRDRCLNVGCNDYVRKPIDRQLMVEAIHRQWRPTPSEVLVEAAPS